MLPESHIFPQSIWYFYLKINFSIIVHIAVYHGLPVLDNWIIKYDQTKE